MKLVYMVHPDLPGQPIRVRRAAVAIHAGSGWQEAPEPAPPPLPPAKATRARPVPQTEESRLARPRRASTEESD